MQDEGGFVTDLRWDVSKNRYVTIKSVEFAISYPERSDIDDIAKKIATRREGDKSIDSVLKERLNKVLLKESGSRAKYSQYNALIKEIAPKVAQYSKSIGEDSFQFEHRLHDAFDVLKSIRFATNQDVRESAEKDELEENEFPPEHIVWHHGDTVRVFREGYNSEHSRKVEVDSLEEEAFKYLMRPWMESEFLEHLIVDALIFAEVTTFGESVKQSMPSGLGSLWDSINYDFYYSVHGDVEKMTWKHLKYGLAKLALKTGFVTGIPIIAGWYFWSRGYHDQVTLVGLVYSAIVIAVLLMKKVMRQLRGQQPSPYEKKYELWQKMFRAYALLQKQVVSPTYLRDQLLAVAKEGAIWPSAIFAVLDHAIKRNPAIWGASNNLSFQ
jgi:predicted negative regulator of RcsB-dependent stress response